MGLLQATATYAAAALAAATLACPVSHELLLGKPTAGTAKTRPEARRMGEQERALQWSQQAAARSSQRAR